MQPLVVITGGPCTGKSTQIREFENDGLAVAHEEARGLIESGLLDLDTQWEAFQRELVSRQMASEATQRGRGIPVFCDRGIFDSVAYSWMKGEMPAFLLEMETPRYALAFLMEPLGFFINDSARKEDLKFTEAITPLLERAYAERGVPVIRVPSLSVPERKQLVLDECRKRGIIIPAPALKS